ncbi:MAG: aminotransferase class I/II-fold pyridoxal phosphate-dependent enzyme, partial [Candidatus Hodarchaeales archaeon]
MNNITDPVKENSMRFGYTGIISELNDLAKERGTFIHLSDCDPPSYGYLLHDTVIKQIDQLQISKYSGYPSWNGDEGLREALSKRIHGMSGTKISREKVVLTYGVSEGFPLTLASLFNNKQGSIAIPDPSYIPLMIQVNRFSNYWFYPCREELNWNPDINQLRHSLEKRPDTKAIVIITPNSPTGAVYPEKVLKELVNVAGQYNLVIITDEIYDSISFTGFNSPLKYAGDIPVVYLNGFSKVYRLPGYRLGYIGWHDPEDKFPGFWKYMTHLCKGRMGVTPLAQEIAKLALQEPVEELE